jgi:hypothetical protein
MQLCFFTLCLPYASLHHILLDSRIYLMMQVTYDKWRILVPLKNMCSTSLSHPPVVGKHREIHRVGKYLHTRQLASSSWWPRIMSCEDVGGERCTSWGRLPTISPPPRYGLVVLRLFGDSHTPLLRADGSIGGRQLALHHQV